MSSTRPSHMRWLYFGIGWVFFGLGVAGALLPVLPTTPFMILALWAFSRSSERFHDWLYNHRVFGPRLQQWRRDRVIPLPVKLTAFTSMAASLAFLIGFSAVPWPYIVAAGCVMAGGVWFIVRCPSKPASEP